MKQKNKDLMIVESPTKIKTISTFFDKNMIIEATYGHLAELPKKSLGINIKKNFELEYQILKDKQKILDKILQKCKNVKNIYLATDPDREGEFISDFLFKQIQNRTNIYRIRFCEITKKAIQKALLQKGNINTNLVSSQKARRAIDRLIGFLVSPMLWKKFLNENTLSAGRVQSVVLNWICTREKEIETFVKKPYYEISLKVKKEEQILNFLYIGKEKTDQEIKKLKKIHKETKSPTLRITKIEKKKETRPSPLPFNTASLEKKAFQVFNFSAIKTLFIAQKLYEGKKIKNLYRSLITYIRTDSLYLSPSFVKKAQNFIEKNYGKKYIGKKKTQSQKAHEAIRPSNDFLIPEIVQPFLSREEFLIYDLIWKQTISSLMPAERYLQHKIQGLDSVSNLVFEWTQKEEIFSSWRILYLQKEKNQRLFSFEMNEILPILKFETKKKYTQPPPRFNEASLIEKMQKLEIGRPSTYALVISTLLKRKYVQKVNKTLKTTQRGLKINFFLQENFIEIFNHKFTFDLEKELEKIALGEREYLETVQNLYKKLQNLLFSLKKKKIQVENSENCPTCKKGEIKVKQVKNKKYRMCSQYPYCDYMGYIL